MPARPAETARKLELLERYRALRMEELLEELRPRAVSEAEQDRFPWRGEFRAREEILRLYRKRKWMDRRFMVDMVLLILLLAFILVSGRQIIRSFVPRPAFAPAGAPAGAPAEAGENGGAGD